MMLLGDYQRIVRNLIIDEVPDDALARLGAPAWRWLRYRRLARDRLDATLEHCFWRLFELIGADRFRQLAGDFLAEAPPRSPFLREAPGELLRWLERGSGHGRFAGKLPACALDLARFEWAELDLAYAFDDPRQAVELTMDRPAVLTAAHRLLRLDHAVQRFAPGETGEPRAEPTALCLYRDARSYEVHTLELTPIAAALLSEIARGESTLADAVRSAAASHGASIDEAFVAALSELLADLLERGLLLGSAPPIEPRNGSVGSRDRSA